MWLSDGESPAKVLSAQEVLRNSLPYGERVLVTGCQGLLGRKVCALLADSNSIIGLDLAPQSHLRDVSIEYHPTDITRRDDVAQIALEAKPGFIINAAAMTDVDGCEVDKDRCWRVNVLAVENLINAAKKIHAHLVHISSDYVFNGTHPPYGETDAAQPLGFYGKSKLASENALRGAGLPHAIIRTQVLYGAAPGIRPDFVNFVLSRLAAGGDLAIVDDQRGMPTLADDLALGIARIMQLRKTGLYHIAGRDSVSRYEFAREIARRFGYDPERIQPTKSEALAQKSPRPPDSTFSLDKIKRELSFLPRGLKEGLEEFQQQWSQLQAASGGETR